MAINLVLLVHPVKETRSLLGSYLLSELSEIELHFAESGENALDCLRTEEYTAIVCHSTLPDMSFSDLRTQIIDSTGNREAPILLLAPSPVGSNPEEWIAEENVSVLPMPFAGPEFVEAVKDLCYPGKWRADLRVHIPNVIVRVEIPGLAIEGKAINITRRGVLCDMPYVEGFERLFGCASVLLLFPEQQGTLEIEAWSDFLRMSVVRWQASNIPETFRAAWRFLTLASEQQHALEKVLAESWEALRLSRVTA